MTAAGAGVCTRWQTHLGNRLVRVQPGSRRSLTIGPAGIQRQVQSYRVRQGKGPSIGTLGSSSHDIRAIPLGLKLATPFKLHILTVCPSMCSHALAGAAEGIPFKPMSCFLCLFIRGTHYGTHISRIPKRFSEAQGDSRMRFKLSKELWVQCRCIHCWWRTLVNRSYNPHGNGILQKNYQQPVW